MTRQYKRQATLIVATSTGDAIDLSQLRIRFKIKKNDAESPNIADIEVYNLTPETSQRIQREFTDIILQAGYEGNFGVVFRGNSKQITRGRPNETDSVLNIIAADGDAAYNFAVVNTTLAAGSTQRDQIIAASAPMNQRGVGLGYMPDMGGQRLARGKVMYGMSRNYMRQSARTTDTTWSIQDGKLQFIPNTGLLPGQAVKLTAETGLIGTPQQTTDGILINCLINPQIKPGTIVDLANSEVNAAKATNFFKNNKDDRKPVAIEADGLYRVLSIELEGDTRGQAWYQTLVCVGIDAAAPPLNKIKGG